MKAKLIQSYLRFRRLPTYLKVRLFFGSVSLIIGLFATNLAIFGWSSTGSFFFLRGENSYYLLGEYARYVCAYGGLGATIFGAMLINDFIVLRKLINEFFALRASIAIKRNTKRSATEWLIRARTEWRLCADFDKFCSMEPGISQDDFFVQAGEEVEVVDDK
ncbi:hypothetical protein E2P60_05370 [Candidatus Bathyarchaeota archaeon]|nr:hypothetical protein E2P60_05370 [Candidatus Bathyarchaeota archaeon]